MFSKLFLVLVLFSGPVDKLKEISAENEYKDSARIAFNNEHFKKAADYYTKLTNKYGVNDAGVYLNLGHAHFHAKAYKKAAKAYKQAKHADDSKTRSIALQQLGILAHRDKKRDKALEHLKNALKADPGNEEARYNYELIKNNQDKKQNNKKKNKEDKKNKNQKDKQNKQNKENQDKNKKQNNKKDQQDQQNKQNSGNNKNKQNKQDKEKKGGKKNKQQDNKKQNKQKQDQQKKADKNQKGDKRQQQKNKAGDQQKKGQKEDKKSKKDKDHAGRKGEKGRKDKATKRQKQSAQVDPEKLKRMNITKEQAEQILEALNNNELQYIQQQKQEGDIKSDNQNLPEY